MLVDALANSLNVPTVNLGLSVGLDQISATLQRPGIPKAEINPVPSMLLGAIGLTPMEVAQEYQTIASGGNRAPLSAVRSVIAEDGTVLYQSFPQAERMVPAQAAYLTLYAMQQGVARGTSRSLSVKFPNYNGGENRYYQRSARQLVRRYRRQGSGDRPGRARQQRPGQTDRRQWRVDPVSPLSGKPDAAAADAAAAGRH